MSISPGSGALLLISHLFSTVLNLGSVPIILISTGSLFHSSFILHLARMAVFCSLGSVVSNFLSSSIVNFSVSRLGVLIHTTFHPATRVCSLISSLTVSQLADLANSMVVALLPAPVTYLMVLLHNTCIFLIYFSYVPPNNTIR